MLFTEISSHRISSLIVIVKYSCVILGSRGRCQRVARPQAAGTLRESETKSKSESSMPGSTSKEKGGSLPRNSCPTRRKEADSSQRRGRSLATSVPDGTGRQRSPSLSPNTTKPQTCGAWAAFCMSFLRPLKLPQRILRRSSLSQGLPAILSRQAASTPYQISQPIRTSSESPFKNLMTSTMMICHSLLKTRSKTTFKICNRASPPIINVPILCAYRISALKWGKSLTPYYNSTHTFANPLQRSLRIRISTTFEMWDKRNLQNLRYDWLLTRMMLLIIPSARAISKDMT